MRKRVDHEKVLELVSEGFTTNQIAEKMECSRETVRRTRACHGCSAPKKRKPVIDRKPIIEDIKAGMAVKDIAKKHGCSDVLVWSVASSHGGIKRLRGEKEISGSDTLRLQYLTAHGVRLGKLGPSMGGVITQDELSAVIPLLKGDVETIADLCVKLLRDHLKKQ